MIKRNTLTKEQVLYAIDSGEFGKDVIDSGNKVVVIMTQDWCPQWHNMSSWIYSLESNEEINIYELIYNKVEFFKEFMTHKESVWQNHEIPYLRYYKNGKLTKESNYKSQKGFLEIING